MKNESSVDDAISKFFQNPQRVTQVLPAGIRLALQQHKQAGNPICSWQNGEIVWIEPDKIPLGITMKTFAVKRVKPLILKFCIGF